MQKSFAQLNLNKVEENSEIGNKISDFEILQVLGVGGYGFVAKVKSKLNLKIYALKKYDSAYLKDEEQKKYILNERIFMKQFDHKNVLKLYNDFYENGDLYLIMEYMDGGDMFTFISAHMSLKIIIDEEKLWRMFEQCLDGLVYLHKKGLIHRDIKPANLLMNSKGEIKYSDFNVSAIINPDKARDFTNNKLEGENLVNNMTQVGSGKYAAPEIYEEISIYQEYDLKVDVYSLGKTFCSLAFFQIDFPEENQLGAFGYSQELIHIIKLMTENNPAQRPSSLQIYNEFIKYYVEKYVYSSGFISCIQILYQSPSLYNYLLQTNLNNANPFPIPITDKLRELFISLEYSRQRSNNLNFINKNEKSFKHLIYDLRKLLLKNGMKSDESGNDEINPIIIMTFLLKKLHEELNIYRGKMGRLNCIYKKYIASDNPKLDAYENLKKFYTNNFRSVVSENFFGLIKTKSICKNCNNQSYSFKVLCYIPFNVKILVENYENKNNLNLYDAFDCLNKNFIQLDKKQYIQCDNCKTVIEHIEFKQFYNLSRNLVIILDRGENYTNNEFINFEENFVLDSNYVENFSFQNMKVPYTLVSVICRIEGEQDEQKRNQEKFVCFTRKANNCYNCSLPGEQEQLFTLENVKSFGTVIILFYYSEYGISNFSDNFNNNNNNINNMNVGQFTNLIPMNNMNNFGNFNNNGNMNINMMNNNNNFNMGFNNNNNNFGPMNPINNNQNQNNNNFGQNFQMNPNFNNQQNNNNNQNFINMNQNNWNNGNNNNNNPNPSNSFQSNSTANTSRSNMNISQSGNNINNMNNMNNNLNNNINMNNNFGNMNQQNINNPNYNQNQNNQFNPNNNVNNNNNNFNNMNNNQGFNNNNNNIYTVVINPHNRQTNMNQNQMNQWNLGRFTNANQNQNNNNNNNQFN